jgi:hypothetical protein
VAAPPLIPHEPEPAMLGPPTSRQLSQPITVSRDDLVPASHFYRHLEAKLVLSFVRVWSRDRYAERGRPSIDPIVFFKLQLGMFSEGIRSEWNLVETARLNLAHRWYLGYALNEAPPAHSSLTWIRQRLGIDVFQRFLSQWPRDQGVQPAFSYTGASESRSVQPSANSIFCSQPSLHGRRDPRC